ncbi:MAG: hypothetical protein EA428_15830 [Spirochaetaceae bacterium]|nr:MAG: hypothetical protein EA428_15830 [Spirochaetaceae bacterium]
MKKSTFLSLTSVGLSFLLVLLPVAGLSAQSETSSETTTSTNGGRLPTIDELYLDSETSVAMLRAQLRTNNLSHQTLALSAVEEQLIHGAIDPGDEQLFDALAFVMNQGVSNLSYQGTNLPRNYHPNVRNHAAKILGLLGTPEARTQLARTVDIDPDPSVRAQALYSLARIGQDPDGSVTRSIGKMMLREHVGRPDPGVMYAALVAIENIHRNADNQIHGAATEMLLQVAVGDPYTRLLRAKAMQVLAKM